MAKLDHLAITVSDSRRVRDWYTTVLGMRVEFEAGDTPSVGLTDDGGMTLILSPGTDVSRCSLYFQVDDVAEAHATMKARGVSFTHGPQPNAWGYGAGLTDPDGRYVGLWDEATMSQGG
jgi:predicted enzyme related to lactoylglutathione lyase